MNAPAHLRVEHLDAPLGVVTATPRFSWWLPDGVADQEAFELVVTDADGREVGSRAEDTADSVLVPYAGSALRSGSAYGWRVRVRAAGGWSPWAESRFETSLLRQDDWHAPFVEPVQLPVTPDGPTRAHGDWVYPAPSAPDDRLHPAQQIRQVFSVGAPVRRARLYATAQGVYAAELNGRSVGDEVLAPGYESYDRALSFQTYDVTSSLRVGENVLGVVLGDGWFAGRIAFTGNSAQYGDRTRASWQLVIETEEGTTEVLSDATVRATDRGPLRYSDIFIGERYDARRELPGWSAPGFDDSDWEPVRIAPVRPRLIPFDGEPVRRIAELPAESVITTPAGEVVVDFGQVIAGRVRMSVTAAAGTEITLEHSEVLDRNGDFLDNIPVPNKDQTDVYVACGATGGETWEPLFTFHGFRYVRLTGYPGIPRAEDFTAVVVGSDLEPAGDFVCSDPSLSRLQRNIVWSQRGNFLSIPTDCPQRERAGWTGDLQIFAPTAVTNLASASFLRRWLHNLRLDQRGDGTVPVIVPASPAMGVWEGDDDPLMSISAAAGWGDAVVLVPWTLYERYGDVGILDENYDAMSAWVERQARVAAREIPARLHERPLDAAQRARQPFLWNSEPNFGDWLAPSVIAAATSLDDILAHARVTGELIGAMFHGRSAELLGRVAAVLGREADAVRWAEHALRVREAFAAEYIDDSGRLMIEAQGTIVLALAFDFFPEPLRAAAVERLVELIGAAGDHLDTGFLSVPYLLDVLVDGGRADVARRLLWQRTTPSWLYEVDRGATTIWEQWDAIRPDGTVVPASFNHYAFGCVGDWLYRRVAGIEPVEPGYRRSRIAPDLAVGVDAAQAHHDTPYGRLAVAWSRAGSRVELNVEVPSGTRAELRLDGASRVEVDGRPAPELLAPGRHAITALMD